MELKSSSAAWGGAHFSVAVDEGGLVTYFSEEVDHFVGFVLDSGNYGWIRVQYDATGPGTLTFLDGAYEDMGQPIAAGNDGSVVLEDADFDGNGEVDGQDFLIWQRGLGLTGQVDNSNGDADGSAIVDGLDLAIWESQYGNEGLAALSVAQVPEPASALLMAWLAVGLFRRLR